jgi:hypothetical protein
MQSDICFLWSPCTVFKFCFVQILWKLKYRVNVTVEKVAKAMWQMRNTREADTWLILTISAVISEILWSCILLSVVYLTPHPVYRMITLDMLLSKTLHVAIVFIMEAPRRWLHVCSVFFQFWSMSFQIWLLGVL